MPPSAKHFNVLLHTLDRAKAERPGDLTRAARTAWPSTSSAAASSSLISDFYEDPDGDPRGAQAAALPRQRSDRVPRARSRRRSTSGSTTRRASRISRAASRCRSCRSRSRDEYRQLIREHIEALKTKFSEQSHRLHAREHGRAARPGAVQLSCRARTADAGAVAE